MQTLNNPVTVDENGNYLLEPQWIEALPYILASRHFSKRVQQEAEEIAQRISVRLIEDPPATLLDATRLAWGWLKGVSARFENQASAAMVDTQPNCRETYAKVESFTGREDALMADCQTLPMIEALEAFDTLEPRLKPWLAWLLGWDSRPAGGHQHELNSLSGIRIALKAALK